MSSHSEAQERTKLCIFLIHGSLVITLSRMAEINDHYSQVTHEDIFQTDISVNYARVMNRR